MEDHGVPCDIETAAQTLTALCGDERPLDQTPGVSWSPLCASDGAAYHGADRLVVACAQVRARHGARCWRRRDPVGDNEGDAASPLALLTDGTVAQPAENVSVAPARAGTPVRVIVSRLVLASLTKQTYANVRQATFDASKGVVLLPTRARWGTRPEDLASLVVAYAHGLARKEGSQAWLAAALAATFALSDVNDSVTDAVPVQATLASQRPQGGPIDATELAQMATLAEDVAGRLFSPLSQLVSPPVVTSSPVSNEPTGDKTVCEKVRDAPTPARRAYTLGESIAAARHAAAMLATAGGRGT